MSGFLKNTKTIDDGAADTYADIYRSLYGAFPQKARSVDSAGLTVIGVNQNDHHTTDPAASNVVFRVVTAGRRTQSSVDIDAGRKTLPGRIGGFYLAPANTDAEWQAEEDHSLLMMAAPERKIRESLLDDPDTNAPDPLGALYGCEIFDATILALMRQIWLESHRVRDAIPTTIDALFTDLVDKLSHHATIRGAPDFKTGIVPLDQTRLDKVIEYVRENLAHKIAINDLAKIAGQSPYHFCRSFREATKVTPHNFVLQQRIALAEHLIASGERPLVEIAYDTGFANQAHFSTTFKSHVGATPGQYRRKVML